MPYMDFLEKNIFRGLDVELYKTSPYEHWHDRIIQESRLTGLDTLRPMSNRLVAAVYGGYGAIMEECTAAFSLKASASTIAKFAGCHAVSRIGGRKNGYRQGNFEGVRTHVESHGDFDFAVVLNTRDFAFDQEFEDLTENHIRPLLDDMMHQFPRSKE
ncbi:penicillin-binding protein [Fusarium sp. NRRL 52700]|nr:penicillin-binding protein [Fusarium sp. NRRL 52700]